MSKLNVDNIENRLGTGGPQLPGATFTDNIVGTAASFTGIVTATSFTGNATGLTGNPSISVTDITAIGNVSIAGTLTYEDVTNVDSIGIITAQSGIDVTSGGINVTGVVTATSFSGDGTNLTNLPAVSGVTTAIASGTLANGDTVILNSDGTVSSVSGVTTTTAVMYDGTEVYYGISDGDLADRYPKNFYISTENLIVTTFAAKFFTDTATVYRTLYSIGKVVGESIEYGPVRVFYGTGNGLVNDDSSRSVILSYDVAAGAVVASYNSGSGGGDELIVKAGPITESKDRIAWGSDVSVLTSNENTAYPIGIVYDANAEKTVLSYRYRDSGTNYHGESRVVSITSSNTVTLGTAGAFYGPSSDHVNASATSYDSDAQNTLLFYANDVPTAFARTITVSGTNVSFGSSVTLTTTNTWRNDNGTGGNGPHVPIEKLVYDATAQKSILSYYYGSSPYTHELLVLSISGTTVSVGSSVSYLTDTNIFNGQGKLCYNPSIGKTVLFSKNASSEEESSVITITGSTPSIGNTTTYAEKNLSVTNVYDTKTNYIAQTYHETGNVSARVFDIEPETTNLTSDNFIGFSDGAYTNGQTATIQTVGSIDDAQTGLTTGKKYYVKKNGDLSLNGNTTPLVFGGVALSSTEIIVKG